MPSPKRPRSLEPLLKSLHSRKVVRDVSLTALRGSVPGLVGPNGSGETATVRGMVSLPEIAIVPSVGGCGIAIAYFVLGYFPRTYRLMGPGLGQTPRICGTASGWHLCQTA